MTEAGKLVELYFQESQEELLYALTHGRRPLERMEDISVQAHFYHNLVPRICEGEELVTVENLSILQRYCLSVWENHSGSLYFELAEWVTLLLNENFTIAQVTALTRQQLKERVDNILSAKI